MPFWHGAWNTELVRTMHMFVTGMNEEDGQAGQYHFCFN